MIRMPKHEKPKVFPDIPRFDEEPPLEGPPQSAEESVFLSTPHLARAADLNIQFQQAKSTERRKLIDSLAEEITQTPHDVPAIFDALEMLREIKSYKTEDFTENLERGIDRVRFKEFPPTPENLEGWLTIAAESKLYKPVAEKILGRMIGRCTDRKSVMEFLYQLALGGFRSANQDVVRVTGEIFGGKKFLTPETAQYRNIAAAFFDTDDETLRRVIEIQHTLNFLTQYRNHDILPFWRREDTVPEDKRISQSIRELRNENPQRFNALMNYYTRRDQHGTLSETPAEVTLPFPLSLLAEHGPLFQWITEQLRIEGLVSTREGRQGVILTLPFREVIQEAKIHSPIELARFIRDRLRTVELGRNEGILEHQGYWQTLAHMVPEASNEDHILRQLAEINEGIRRDIRDNTTHLLSPRGDLIEITDPLLREWGFQSILFEMDARNRRDTIVTIDVERYQYRALLDEYFSLRTTETRQGITLSQRGNFILNVMLSHLREIRCTENVDEVSGGEQGEGEEHLFFSRRAHLRRLPENHNPTPEQIRRALTTYDIDLIRINREARLRGEHRKRTFVFETEISALAGRGPIRSRAPDAMRELTELLSSYQPQTSPENE